MNTPNQKSAFANLLQSNTFRMLLIGTLTLLLLIPLAFVKDLVRERKHRQERVIQEIDEKWGGAIFFYGPILKIPYKIYLDTKRTSFKTSYAYFFPEELKNTSEVETEVKKRNNYESVVFNATMNFTGKYTTPDFSIKGIPQEDVEWDKASILIRTTNLSSIKNGVTIELAGASYPFEPIYNEDDRESYTYNTSPYQNNEDEYYYNELSSTIASLETGFIRMEEVLK